MQSPNIKYLHDIFLHQNTVKKIICIPSPNIKYLQLVSYTIDDDVFNVRGINN